MNPPDPKSHIIHELKQTINLLDSSKDPHFTIHEVRKSFKKIRSYLRLIQEQLDFKTENQFFRNLGLKLSDLRDLSTCMEAMESLDAYGHTSLSVSTSQKIQDYLLKSRDQLSELLLVRESILKNIRYDLLTKLDEVHSWETHEDRESLDRNFKETIKQVKKASSIARKSDDTEDYHEWRKKVKHLRYQSEIVLLTFKDPHIQDKLHKLSDFLGWDHDLAILEQVISENTDLFRDTHHKEEFLALLNSRRNEFRSEAQKVDETEFSDLT